MKSSKAAREIRRLRPTLKLAIDLLRIMVQTVLGEQ